MKNTPLREVVKYWQYFIVDTTTESEWSFFYNFRFNNPFLLKKFLLNIKKQDEFWHFQLMKFKNVLWLMPFLFNDVKNIICYVYNIHKTHWNLKFDDKSASLEFLLFSWAKTHLASSKAKSFHFKGKKVFPIDLIKFIS